MKIKCNNNHNNNNNQEKKVLNISIIAWHPKYFSTHQNII